MPSRTARDRWWCCCTGFRSPGTPGDIRFPRSPHAGYRVVAIDQRGYGRSSKYRVQSAYRIKELVGDVVGVIDAYGADKAVVVGHDWGAPVAWTFAWLHPDRCAGVVGISVPFAGRGVIGLPGSPFGEHRPNDYHLELAGDGRVWYQDYFSAQDGIIAEIEEDVRGWLLGLTYTVSGEGMIAATKAAVDAGVDLAAMDPIDVIRAGPLCMAEGAPPQGRVQLSRHDASLVHRRRCRLLHKRIRTLRLRRPAELLSQHRQRLARPGRPGRTSRSPHPRCSSAANTTSAPPGVPKPSSVRTR